MKSEFQKGSRSKILAALMLIIMFLFVARLFYLQIIKHDYYVNVAKTEQVKRLTIPAKRGLIYALDGDRPVPLVMNQTIYTVFADPQTVVDGNKVVDVIRRIAGGNARPNLSVLLENKESRYQILATKITRVQADKIKAENLKGIGFQEMTQRVYPEGMLAAQVLGFVNNDGLGQYGIEEKLNDQLIGTDGLLQSVTDVSDVPLTIGNDNIHRPAVDGKNIVLSIDSNVQSHVEQALADGLTRTGATKGSVIVMDPQNGRVMAMANLPTYDPANFNNVDDVSIFNNAVVSAPYEPGSDIKTLTMATGIDKGVVRPDSTYNNMDYIQVDDRTIINATFGHTGMLTFQQALTWSLNTGFVTVAQRLGDGISITKGARDTMYDYFTNKFKLGHLTDIEVAGEMAGIVISPDNVDGNAVRYSNMSFGQGLDATMVQVASAFCSLVNGGKYFKPTVIAGIIDKNGVFNSNSQTESSTSVSESTASQVREMTHIVRTSSASNIDLPGYYIGGKTGTSQVIRDGQYADDEAVGTYLGFGGSEDMSRYVIMIQLSAPHKVMRGAQEVGPIFTDISNWMLNYLKVQPKG